jgi:sucrose-6-phosphate hydrolase SacC (GH32 family)
MVMPREIYAGPEGLLYIKPVDEVLAVYKNTLFDLTDAGVLKADEAARTFDVPVNYMMQCQFKLDTDCKVTFVIGGDYRLTLDPANGCWILDSKDDERINPLPIDFTKPLKLQIFVERDLIECFINDQFAQTCSTKKRSKKLEIDVEAGSVEIQKLKVKTAAPISAQ